MIGLTVNCKDEFTSVKMKDGKLIKATIRICDWQMLTSIDTNHNVHDKTSIKIISVFVKHCFSSFINRKLDYDPNNTHFKVSFESGFCIKARLLLSPHLFNSSF